MSLATLMAWPSDARGQNAFSFDHQQAHNSLVAAMTTANLFNLANYLLDPMPAQVGGGNPWSLNHQTAHDDAADWYGVQPSLNLLEQSPSTSPWWIWANFSEHMALSEQAFLMSLD